MWTSEDEKCGKIEGKGRTKSNLFCVTRKVCLVRLMIYVRCGHKDCYGLKILKINVW